VHRAWVIIAAAACACACSTGMALASQTAKLDVRLQPERLGTGTTIIFGFQITGSGDRVPSPLTEIDLRYPGNLGIEGSGLGVDECLRPTLEALGPAGCPVDSRMGYGSALVEVPFGPLIVRETATTKTFMAPISRGRLALLFYADGESPISAQIVFPAVITTAPSPFGGSLDTTVPLVPSVPQAPNVAVVRLRTTLGPLHLTYYKRVRGRRTAYTPRGIVLPRSCPQGGFPFAAHFGFEDGTHTTAATNIPCPGR
jgi:hypothetical protein